MKSDRQALGQIIERAMKANNLNNSQLAAATGFSEGAIRNLKKFGVTSGTWVPTIQLLVAVSNILKLDPIGVLQIAGLLPTPIYSQGGGALGEYVRVHFESLPIHLQDRFLGVLAELEREAGLESLSQALNRFIPKAEALGKRRWTLADQAGLVIGRLTGITTEELMLRGIQRRMTILFPDEAIDQEKIIAVAQHPVAQALMTILLPRRDVLPGLEKLYFLLFFNEDRLLPEERTVLLRDTWRLLVHAAES